VEGQNLLDRLPRPVVQTERDSGLRLLLAAFELEPEFQEEKFFEDQPDVSWGAGGLQVLKTLAGIGPVNLPQRVPRRDQAEMVTHGSWNRIGNLRREIFQYGVDDAPKPARCKPSLPGRLVNGNDPADFKRSGGFLFSPLGFVGRVAQNFELRLDQLQFPATLLFYFAVKCYKLPGLKAVTQIRGVKPDTFQSASALAGCHLKDGHAAGAEKSRSADFRDDRGHLAYAKLRNPTRVHAVLVAEGQVMEQIVDRVDALGPQHLGQARADALYILDRGGKLEHHRDVSRRGP